MSTGPRAATVDRDNFPCWRLNPSGPRLLDLDRFRRVGEAAGV